MLHVGFRYPDINYIYIHVYIKCFFVISFIQTLLNICIFSFEHFFLFFVASGSFVA